MPTNHAAQLEEVVRKCLRGEQDPEIQLRMEQLRSCDLGTVRAVAGVPTQECGKRMQPIPLGLALQLHEEALRTTLEVEVVVVLEALGLLARVCMHTCPRVLLAPRLPYMPCIDARVHILMDRWGPGWSSRSFVRSVCCVTRQR